MRPDTGHGAGGSRKERDRPGRPVRHPAEPPFHGWFERLGLVGNLRVGQAFRIKALRQDAEESDQDSLPAYGGVALH